MKHLTLLILFALTTLTAAAQPSLRFDVRAKDLGAVSEKNGVASGTFTFTNTGDEPLVILKTETACKCTKAAYTKSPVMPGKTGTVTVAYNPRKQPQGAYFKTIRVFANTPEKQYVLTVKGTVRP